MNKYGSMGPLALGALVVPMGRCVVHQGELPWELAAEPDMSASL